MKFATYNPTDKPGLLETVFTPYRLGINDPKYEALRVERGETEGIKCFQVISVDKKDFYNEEMPIQLETAFIFGNQWNTTSGYRVFNWFEDYDSYRAGYPRGHYLKITPEMRQVCQLTHKCGYCGAEYYGEHNTNLFCGECLSSQYLKADDLRLLRLKPVDINGNYPERADLTEEEAQWLLPLYASAQLWAGREAAVKVREKVEADYLKELANLQNERDGKIWLLDRGFSIDNVIYYNHTGQFSFGWRKPLDPDTKSRLLDVLSEFPYEYEIE